MAEAGKKKTQHQRLYPDLEQKSDDGQKEEDTPTKRIKVSKLPDRVTDDVIKYFFENRKICGGCDVDTVDYDKKTNTAIVIFKDEEDVEKVMTKCPLLFDDKHIVVEKYYMNEEPDETEYNECTIEVTGMNQTSSKYNLMLYFESKKGAGDDVLSIIYIEEQEMYLVRFSSEDVVDAVLRKRHELDGSELQVRKHMPPKPEETYPKQVSVSGFDAMASEVLINYLEARSKADVDKVIYGDIEGSAIVVFKTQPDVIKLKEECKKKQLNGRYVNVDSVPLTKCIIVSNIKDSTTEDAVMFYFDNKRKSGVEGVDDVDFDSTNKTCIVYFVDSDAPVTACKREHIIEGQKVKVDLYYEVLGGTGRGDGPKFRPPDPIDLVLDVKKVQFLANSNTGKNKLEQQLKVCHASVKTWPAMKTGTLKIECTLTADMKDCKKLVKNWETNVNKSVDKVMNEIYTDEYQTLQEEWKPIMDKVRGINLTKPDMVALNVESSKCEMVIVGYKQQVTELSRQLKSIVTEVKAVIEKKKQQVKEKMPLKYHQIMILIMLDFPNKKLKSYKDLDVKTDIGNCEMVFEGLSKDVTAAKLKTMDELKNICSVDAGTLSKYTAAFLEVQEVKDYVLDQFMKKKKIGIWEIPVDENELVMYGRSDREVNDCVQIFRSSVIETQIIFDNNKLSLLKSDMWRQEVKKITDKYPKNLIQILYDTEGKIIIMCTSSRDAGVIREDIEDFIRQNTSDRWSLELSPGQRKLLDIPYFDGQFKAIEKNLQNDKVQITLGSRSISVQSNAKGMPSAKSRVEAIIGTISIKNHVISKPGIIKFMLTEQGKNIIKTAEKNVGVVIDILIDGEKRMDLGLRERQPTLISFNTAGLTETAQCDIRGGPTIITVIGDITKLSTDVIVNAANDELDHRGGLAKAIVNKGGQDIQTECSKYIKQHGKLSDGEVYCSKAGKLKCKIIVHAVGPVWKGGKNDEEEALSDCVRHSLEETDQKSLVSIAFPAISTGVYGYPKEKAAKVIVRAVHNYFNSNTKSKIKRIYMCDVKDDTIRYFVDAMRKCFGNVRHLIDPEETVNPWKNQTEQNGVQTGGRSDGTIVTFGNISVRVVKGQLAKQKVDAIVNSTSRDLRLESGMLSKSLLKEGGQTLQNECNKNYPNGIKEGEVARTSGGNLSCKEVFHGCLPSWQYEQSSIKILETFVRECLDICTKSRHKSIAFPSLGTGKLGYPADQVAKYMFSCVENFSSDAPKTSVKDVLFVVYDEDHKSIKAFEDERRRKTGNPKRKEERFSKENHDAEKGRPRSARPGTAQGRQFVVDLNGIQLKVYQGDITTARVDVIVNSCNTECDLSKGAVAQAILKKGGREVTADINKQKDKMKKEGIVVTKGGQVACDKIIHLDMQNSSIDLKTKIFKVLKMADEMSKQKVAMPALGTANANIAIEAVAMEILGVIYNYHPKSIQEVHVVIYQSGMLKSFIDASGKCMEKIKSDQTNFMATVVQNMGIGPKSATRRKREWKMTEPTNVSEFSVVVFGKNKSDTDEAVKELERSISKEFIERLVTGKIIKEFTKEQENDLKKLEVLEGVEIKLDAKNAKIIVRGFMVSLSPAIGKVNDIVKIAELNKQAGQKAKLVSESVQWYFICNEDGKDELREYPSYINLQLEQDFTKLEEISTFKDKSGNTFVVDFTSMQEYSENDKNDCVQVVRKSKFNTKDTTFEPPEHWDIMGDKENYQVVILKTSKPEYTDVMNKFHKSVGSQRQIVEIHRIQNKTLYQQYVAKKKSIESTNPPGHKNEQTLWHGFAKDAMESINKFGFNRSYCGKNATAYGDGVYFAKHATYSAQNTYSVPDSNGNKRMYMCKVLTGEYTSGHGGMRTPPVKSQGTHLLYDSVVDFPPNPSMYIIFHDVQAYPEYMIMFQ